MRRINGFPGASASLLVCLLLLFAQGCGAQERVTWVRISYHMLASVDRFRIAFDDKQVRYSMDDETDVRASADLWDNEIPAFRAQVETLAAADEFIASPGVPYFTIETSSGLVVKYKPTDQQIHDVGKNRTKAGDVISALHPIMANHALLARWLRP
jgi:hypothetical protein